MSGFDRAEARRYAKFRAALILDAVIGQGWEPDDLIEEKGKEYVDFLADEILKISQRLLKSSGRY